MTSPSRRSVNCPASELAVYLVSPASGKIHSVMEGELSTDLRDLSNFVIGGLSFDHPAGVDLREGGAAFAFAAAVD